MLGDGEFEDLKRSVYNNEPFKYFRKMYHLVTVDKFEKDYFDWVDFALDMYLIHRECGFDDRSAQVCALRDGLEELLYDDE